MMTGLTGQRSVTTGLKSGISHLHNSFVGCVKTIFVADGLNLCVIEIAFSRFYQPLNGKYIRLNTFQAHPEQIIQGHQYPPLF